MIFYGWKETLLGQNSILITARDFLVQLWVLCYVAWGSWLVL